MNNINAKSIIICLMVVTSLLFSGIYAVKLANQLPVKLIRLHGQINYTDTDTIKAAVSDMLADGFLALNLRDLQDKLNSLTWVKSSGINKQWPSKLDIILLERQPLAVFNNQAVITTEGKLIYPDEDFFANAGKLPVFVGDDSDIKSYMNSYFMLLEKLKPVGLTIVKLEKMADNGWQAMLDNEVIIILGQSELQDRIRRFVLAYTSKLVNDVGKIAIVDMRYTNGAAVTFKPASQKHT